MCGDARAPFAGSIKGVDHENAPNRPGGSLKFWHPLRGAGFSGREPVVALKARDHRLLAGILSGCGTGDCFEMKRRGGKAE
jgi:hypothetical protein